MKSVVCIQSSPNDKGNTATLVRKICERAGQLQASTRTFAIGKAAIKGCTACQACKGKSDVCVLRDDLSEPLLAAQKADVLVLASPVYFGDLNAQMKAFVDRTYSWLVPGFYSAKIKSRCTGGRTLILVLAQGAEDHQFADLPGRYESFLKWYGFDRCLVLRGCGLQGSGDAGNRPALLKQAVALAEKALT